MKVQRLAMFLIPVMLSAPVAYAQPRGSTGDAVSKAILRLPYYGPFDAISVSVDKGTVALAGSAYALGLKQDAERTVKRVAGVDQVINKIEPLPPSPNDDDLRWRVFYAIYTSGFLSHYAPGGDLLWGHRDGIHRAMQFGLEPLGRYPVHIIVEHGRVRLMGMVDTAAERTAAELAARGVWGSFGVENQITVHNRQ